MIELAWPWMFLLVPLPWLVRRLWPPGDEAPGPALRVPFFQRLVTLQGGRPSRSRPRWPLFLATLAWLCLLAAAARPQWLGEPESLPVSGRDLMLAVDLSASMERPDFDLRGRRTTRLEVVKTVAEPFIQRRVGDRIGLILFGKRAYVQTPLTFDRTTVQRMLAEAEIGIAGKETAIGDAIGLAVQRLRERPSESRVLILLTDGANTAGEVKPAQAARLAAAEGLKIYTIGVGAEEMAVDTFFGQRVVNPSSELDERLLRRIAEVTGGAYFRAKDTEGFNRIYRTIDELEPVISDTRTLRPVTPLYPWPLGMALALAFLTVAATHPRLWRRLPRPAEAG